MPINEKWPYGECLKLARTAAGCRSLDEAARKVPFSVAVVGRHERGGPARPSAADALLYARAYGAPELVMQYCRLACPIGCRTMCQVQERALLDVTVRAINRLKLAPQVAERLAAIADDGIIDATERPAFEEILGTIRSLRTIADELELYAARTQKKTPTPLVQDARRQA